MASKSPTLSQQWNCPWHMVMNCILQERTLQHFWKWCWCKWHNTCYMEFNKAALLHDDLILVSFHHHCLSSKYLHFCFPADLATSWENLKVGAGKDKNKDKDKTLQGWKSQHRSLSSDKTGFWELSQLLSNGVAASVVSSDRSRTQLWERLSCASWLFSNNDHLFSIHRSPRWAEIDHPQWTQSISSFLFLLWVDVEL